MLIRNPISVALLAASGALCAQTETPQDLEPIVVTASRSQMPLDHVVQSITVIDRAEIERRQVVHVADLLRSVPGVTVARSGGVGTQTQVRVRGAESNHVLVMIDGIEANDPASGDEFRFENLLAADIERIEIVRGPQSALWGTDAVAGVINVITRGGSGGAAASAQAEGGSHGHVAGSASASFGGDRLRTHVGVHHARADGTNIARDGDEDDGFDATTLTGKLNADLGGDAQFEAVLRYVDASTDVDGVDFIETGLPTDADLTNDAERLYARTGIRWEGGARISHSLAATWLDSDNQNLAAGAVTERSAADKLDVRYQADFVINSAQRLSGAVEFEQADFNQRGAATSFGDPNQDQQIETLAAVAEYAGTMASGWDWTVSARFEDHSDFDDALTWQGGVGYALNDRSRLRFAAGSGRKAPTFTERFGYFADVFVGNPDLEPERSRSIELGYQHQFEDASLEVIWFHQNLEDEINGFVFDPATGGFTAANEAGESRREGVELIADWRPAPAWRISGNYTYTDATEADFGRRVDELRRPRHMASVGILFAPPQAAFEAGLDAAYNSTRDDVFFPPFPEPSRTVALDGYALVDLTARYRISAQLDVFGRINNAFGEDYENVFGFATPGRTFVAGLRYRFDR